MNTTKIRKRKQLQERWGIILEDKNRFLVNVVYYTNSDWPPFLFDVIMEIRDHLKKDLNELP